MRAKAKPILSKAEKAQIKNENKKARRVQRRMLDTGAKEIKKSESFMTEVSVDNSNEPIIESVGDIPVTNASNDGDRTIPNRIVDDAMGSVAKIMIYEKRMNFGRGYAASP